MIANRILEIEESSTLAMAQKSRELTKQGKKICHLRDSFIKVNTRRKLSK